MPFYMFKCRDSCGWKLEVYRDMKNLDYPVECPDCGGKVMRDWKGEGATNNFHPTVDLYSKSKLG